MVLEPRDSLPFKLNAAAALIAPCIMPFTVLVIKPVNDALFAKVERFQNATAGEEKVDVDVQKEGELSTKQLLDKWTKLHLIRTAITGVGAMLAIWAALDKREGI